MSWDCEDCVKRLDQLVDRELNGLEVEEVQAHMQHCGDCVRRYAFHESLKTLVKVSCTEKAPADLRARMRELLG